MPNNDHDDNTQSFVPLSKGTRVGHYKIIDKIGAGGMGEVYLAEDIKLRRQVALKFLPHHYTGDKDLRERFTREAQAAAKLDHPNIVPVYEVGEFQGRPYFAMAHIEGESLRDKIRKDKLGTDDAVGLTMQILDGLHKAHEAGVVHRDIKPGNIIIDKDGRARLVDFGLAMVSGEDRLTKTGSTLGTVGYMSPEQVQGKKCDHRSDLFSVGVILYEMLAGRRPFEGDNEAAVARAIADSSPEPVARYKSGTTGEIQQIVDKALSKDPGLRYQSAAGMLADLKRLQIAAPIVKRGKLGYWMAAVIIVAVGGYLGYSHLFKGQAILSDGPKRLVVLPFNNLGDSTQAYFASGMTDEIINRLTSIQDLQVVARRSAAKLKAAGVDISDIGKELGVEYVLDVSTHFQESSTGARRVKLVTQLIKVSDESVLWGKTYDTVMTEIFTIQSTMAEQVAEQLGVVLTPQEKQAVWARFTDSEAAWDFYIRGWNYFITDSFSRKYLLLALEMYNKAIELDSTFARAYANKGQIYNRLYFYNLARSDSCKIIAKESINKAFDMERFHPIGSHARWALGDYYYRCERDYPRALEQFQTAFEGYGGKDNIRYRWDAHNCLRRMGRIEEAYDHMKILAEAEPRDGVIQYDFASTCERMRRYEEAEEIYLKAIEVKPDYIHSYDRLVQMYLRWQGDTKKARDIIELSWDKIEDTTRWNYWFVHLNAFEGNLEAMKEYCYGISSTAWYYDMQGITDSARIYWDSIRQTYEEFFENNDPTHAQYSYYGIIHARLGNREEALRYAHKAIEMMPLSRDAWDGMDPIEALFNCYVLLKEFDNAVEQAEKILQMPAYFDLGLTLLDPDCRELIKYPDFARLIEVYGNDYHKRLFREKIGAI